MGHDHTASEPDTPAIPNPKSVLVIAKKSKDILRVSEHLGGILFLPITKT